MMVGRSAGETFDSAGVPIYYVDSGPVSSALPVVFVHGFMGSTSEWKATRKTLADRHRMVALDCRGHGRSGKPHGAAAYGSEMASDVARLMDHLGIEAARVVGYSMGAEISLKLATLHPDRVQALHIGGSGWTSADGLKVYQMVADSLDEHGGIGPFLDEIEDSDDPLLAGYNLSWFKKQAFKLFVKARDSAALAGVARGMASVADLTEADVARLSMPVRGIAGELDPERPALERLIGVAPDYEFTMIPDEDHLSVLKAPAYRSSILEFLDTST